MDKKQYKPLDPLQDPETVALARIRQIVKFLPKPLSAPELVAIHRLTRDKTIKPQIIFKRKGA